MGSPELVALATSADVGMRCSIVMSNVDSTFSGANPTLSSARLSTRWRCCFGKLSRSSVSQAILTFLRVGTSSVVTSRSSSVSSKAWRTCSSKAGEVSTTMTSKFFFNVSRTRATSEAGIESLASGWTGATRVENPSLCGVNRGSSTEKSRASCSSTASAIVRAGKSCSVMAMSPKARSRSTRHTRRFLRAARATARLAAMVVLPTPPLGEKTVTCLP